MDRREREALDRHITGNYGEDQFKGMEEMDIETDSKEWWTDHNNMATLWEWLTEIGSEPHDSPSYFMEKPWKWNLEYDVMLHVRFNKGPLNNAIEEVLEATDRMEAW